MPGTPKREWKRPNPCRPRLYIDVTECVCVCVCVCVCTFTDDRRVGRAHYHYTLEVFYFFSSIFLSLDPSLQRRRPTPTSPLIIARKSEFIHTRTIAYTTRAHTPARMKRFWEKKINPHPPSSPSSLFRRGDAVGPPRHNGYTARDASTEKEKKFRLSRTRAESNPQLPRTVVRGPDSSSSFFSPPFLCIPFLLFTRTTTVGNVWAP